MAELELYDLMNICPVCDGEKKKPVHAGMAPTSSAAGSEGDDCPHCEGRGFIATPSGRALLEFLEHMRKS